MMRKPTWWDLGIAVLGLVLVCSAAPGVAQAPDAEGSVGDVTQDSRITGTSDGMGSDQGLTTGGTAPQTGTGGSGTGQGTGTQQATDTGQGTELEAQQRVEIARLRAQVAGLEQQLAQMRVQVARAQAATQGVGGSGQGGSGGQGVGGSGQAGSSGQDVGSSGTAGMGDDPNAGAPTGASAAGNATAEGAGGGGNAGGAAGTSAEGVAVANVIHTGRVRSVNPQRLVLDEGGGFSNTLSLARDVRVTRDGQQVALRNLSEGTLVRTSANLYAKGNPVTSIEVLSSPAGSGKK